MNFLTAMVLSVMLLPSSQTKADDQPNRELSLHECLELALRNNYDIRIERFSPLVAGLKLAGSYGVYEPSLNFDAGEKFLTQPSSFDPKKTGIDAPYELKSDSVGMGLSGLLPTGLTVH